MKDKTGGLAIEVFVGLKPKMYSFLIDDNIEHKKAKVWKGMLLQYWVMINIKMYCWTINVWDIQLIESKVRIIE